MYLFTIAHAMVKVVISSLTLLINHCTHNIFSLFFWSNRRSNPRINEFTKNMSITHNMLKKINSHLIYLSHDYIFAINNFDHMPVFVMILIQFSD